MKPFLWLWPLLSLADVRTVTLKEAIDLALKQNPDLTLARLDERQAQENVRVVKDPFTPRIAVGSGLAYNNGFPLSIEGAAPSVVEAQANQYIFNRQQTYLVARAKENARGAGIAVTSKQDEVVYQVAARYLEAERTTKELDFARKQVDALERIGQSVAARVAEGRELPVEATKARLNLARAKQRVQILESQLKQAQNSLAAALGFDEDDVAHPASEKRDVLDLPVSEEEAVERAMRTSKELRRIESDILAEGLDIKAQKAARLPRVDLVAKYGILAKFNNYEDFFKTFQRHNGLVGISIQVPVLVGPAVSALSAQAEVNAARLRVRRTAIRHRISLDARKSYRDVNEAQAGSDVARLDLDVSREQLSVVLAQMGEGRASLEQVEAARFGENEKWILFYEAHYALELARLDLLRQTGSLASIR